MKKLKNWMKSKEHRAFFILMLITMGIIGFVGTIIMFPQFLNYFLGSILVGCILMLFKCGYELILLNLKD